MKKERILNKDILLIILITLAGLIPFYGICKEANIEPTSLDYYLYFWRGCPKFHRQNTSFFREIPLSWLLFQFYCLYQSLKVLYDHLEERGEQIFTRLRSREIWWKIEWKNSFILTVQTFLIHLATIILFSIFFGDFSYRTTMSLHMDITGIDIRSLASFEGILTLFCVPISLVVFQLMAKFVGLYFSTVLSYIIMLIYIFLGILMDNPLFILSNEMYLRTFSSLNLFRLGLSYAVMFIMGILLILFGDKKIKKRNIL